MRKGLLFCALSALCSAGVLNTAEAETVFCVNCSDQVTSYLTYLNQGQQLLRQIALVQNAIQNTQSLTTKNAGPTQADLAKINTILQQAQQLTLAANNLTGMFNQRYGAFSSYSKTPITQQMLQQKMTQWSADNNAANLTMMRAGQTQWQQLFNSQKARLNQLQTQSRTVKGNLDAQQTTHDILLEVAQGLQRLNATILLDMQARGVLIQNEVDERTMQNAATVQHFKFQPSTQTHSAFFK